jgi:hypothetical protein
MPATELTLSAVAKRLRKDRVTLRRRMRHLGMVGRRVGPSKVLDPDQIQRLAKSFESIPRLY